jgi:hypothetical protein
MFSARVLLLDLLAVCVLSTSGGAAAALNDSLRLKFFASRLEAK